MGACGHKSLENVVLTTPRDLYEECNDELSSLNFTAVFEFRLNPRKLTLCKHFWSAKTAVSWVQLYKYNTRSQGRWIFEGLVYRVPELGARYTMANKTSRPHPHEALTLLGKSHNEGYHFLHHNLSQCIRKKWFKNFYSGGWEFYTKWETVWGRCKLQCVQCPLEQNYFQGYL